MNRDTPPLPGRAAEPTDLSEMERLKARVEALESELHASRERERMAHVHASEVDELFRNAPCAFYALDLQGRFINSNRTMEQWTGYSREELLGRDVETMLTPNSVALLRSRRALMAQDGALEEAEFDVVRKDGSILPLLVSTRGMRDNAGRYFGVHTTAIDITERRRALAESNASRIAALNLVEDAVEARRQADRLNGELRTSQNRLNLALAATRLALWDIDLTANVVYLSEAWSEILGGPSQPTVTTLHPGLESLVLADDMALLQTAQDRAITGVDDGYQIEYRVRRHDGEFIWILSEGHVTERAPDGRALRMVGTVRDVTDRKHAQAQRAQLETQLRESQKMEAVGVLAGGIAHDFNNILGGILGNVALARQDLEDTHPALPRVAQIQQSAVRARSLVQQILAFSRRQSTELVAQLLRSPVEDSLVMMRSLLPTAAHLEVALTDVPIYVLADATQIQQVLMNLCTNAWHALQGKPGRITVGMAGLVVDAQARPRGRGRRLTAGRYLHLWVSDTGCGMDAATSSRVFEPFFTTKPAGQGTGLGLSVVHGIVTGHGGVIEVASVPGSGSTFDIYLPEVEPETQPVRLEPQILHPVRDQGVGKHVLYLDDDEVMVSMVEGLLARYGYRVSVFLDAQAALAQVRANPYGIDLVVTDFTMPEISGLDVARELAALRPNLPVVISSGYITDELRLEALPLGVRHLMHKENTVDELAGVVHRILFT